MRVIALSSGTSVDGIDVAVADLALDQRGSQGTVRLTPVLHREVEFSHDLRSEVLDSLPPASTDLERVCQIDTRLGQEFAAAARAVLDEVISDGDAASPPELVVSHGQTLFHWVEDGSVFGTLQLGQPAWIAEATGLPVLSA